MSSQRAQGGGFVLGLIVGLLVGLAVALGVALYITKVPIPYLNKVPQRSAEQDIAEAQKNRNWDPNAGLQGKSASRASAAASAASAASAPSALASPSTNEANSANSANGANAVTARDPAAILAGAADAVPAGADKGATATRPFLLQAGAFQRLEDAQAQRAKLALLGLEARIVDREQSAGRTVYRVRIGPYDKRSEAELVKDKLSASGVESVLMQAQAGTP